MHSPPLYKQSTLRAWRLILLAICKTRRQHQVFTATTEKQFYGRNSAARPVCKIFPTCGSARVYVFLFSFPASADEHFLLIKICAPSDGLGKRTLEL
jgi:hypothetical protein